MNGQVAIATHSASSSLFSKNLTI